jgi:hypothetical protein
MGGMDLAVLFPDCLQTLRSLICFEWLDRSGAYFDSR